MVAISIIIVHMNIANNVSIVGNVVVIIVVVIVMVGVFGLVWV